MNIKITLGDILERSVKRFLKGSRRHPLSLISSKEAGKQIVQIIKSIFIN